MVGSMQDQTAPAEIETSLQERIAVLKSKLQLADVQNKNYKLLMQLVVVRYEYLVSSSGPTFLES